MPENSRLSRRSLSLSLHATQLAVLAVVWCRVRLPYFSGVWASSSRSLVDAQISAWSSGLTCGQALGASV